MNKIEQMMHDQIGTGQNTLTLHIAKDCASLTEKLMCGFAEWVRGEYIWDGLIWDNAAGDTYTTTQLLELYKETL